MKQKLTKKQLKEIREFATTIPETYYIANQKVVLTAKEILDLKDASPSILELQEKIINEKIKDETKLVVFKEVYEKVNHYNRLKKIAYESGESGCRKYIDEQIELFALPTEIDLHSKII